MASGGGSGGTLIAGAAIIGVGILAYLYFTKEFCPDGAYPNEALCYRPGMGNIDEDTASCETLCSYAYCDTIAERRKAGKCKGVCKHCDPSSAGGGPEVGDPHKQKTPSACSAWGGVWKANQCNCNTVIKKCKTGQVAGILNGKCACGKPKSGAKVSGTGSGSTGGGAKVSGSGSTKTPLTGTQLNNGKLLIASAVATVVKACTGRGISSVEIVRGWPSAITQLAQMNNYSTKIVQYNNRPFAALFRKVVVAVIAAYKLKVSQPCSTQIACLGSKSLKECGLL